MDRLQYEQHKENYATHTVVPANHNPELGVCSVCGAGEVELELYSCDEYKNKKKFEEYELTERKPKHQSVIGDGKDLEGNKLIGQELHSDLKDGVSR